jgi:tetratricopeptide (TPR) repeat protein
MRSAEEKAMNRSLLWMMGLLLVVSCAPAQFRSAFTSAKAAIKGSYYLDSGSYERGIAGFKTMLEEDPQNAALHYYLGRLYLAADNALSAEPALQKAVGLNPNDADYHFWLGVAYAANSKPSAEQESYLNALAIDEKHLQALIYLGHNRYDAEAYEGALDYYTHALELSPEIPSALYNRAMILRRLGRTPEERAAWSSYLEIYRSGAFARQAVQYLNAHGDFQFRNYRIGRRMVTIKAIEFSDSGGELSREAKTSLDYIGNLLQESSNATLHIVSFQLGNPGLAEKKAKIISAYLRRKLPRIQPVSIKASWFDQPQRIQRGGNEILLADSIHFFTIPNRP